MTIAGIVAYDGQITGALHDQRVDQDSRHACHPETPNEDGGPIRDPLHSSERVVGDQ